MAHNGVSRIGVENQEVLVIGAGAIGLLATSVAKALGASKIMIADINEERLQLAQKMGADILINCKKVNLHEEVMRLTNGDGVPRLVEASGASALVNSSFKLLQKVKISSHIDSNYKKNVFMLYFRVPNWFLLVCIDNHLW